MNAVRRPASNALPVGLCLTGGLLFTWALFHVSKELHEAAVRADFEQAAENRINAVQREIDLLTQSLYGLRALHASGGGVSPEAFRAFADSTFAQRWPGRSQASPRTLRALAWAPCVRQEERAAFELQMRRQAAPDYEIRQREGANRLARSEMREMYVPIAYIEPLRDNAKALGLNLFRNSGELPIEAARDQGAMVATSRASLVQDEVAQPSVVVFLPVFRGGGLPATVRERRQSLAGFYVAALHISDLVEAGLSYLKPAGLDVTLEDMSAPGSDRLLYRHGSRLAAGQQTRLPWLERPLERQQDIRMPGRTWRVTCTATPRFFAGSRSSWQPPGLAALTLVLTVLACVYVNTLLARTSEIERTVRVRTQQLSETNDSLSEEVRKRTEAQQRLGEAHRRAMEVVRELEESEGRLKALFESAPDAYCLIEGDGVLMKVNRLAEELTGRGRDELTGASLLDAGLLAPEDVDRFAADLRSVAGGKTFHTMEYTFVHRSGKRLPVEVHSRPIELGGRTLIFMSMRDLTARRETEREERRRAERIHTLQNAILKLTTDAAVVAGDTASAVRTVTETAAEAACVDRVGVWLVEPAESRLCCQDIYARADRTHSRGADIPLESCPDYLRITGSDVQATLDVPIRSAGEVMGLLCLATAGLREWEAEEISFAGQLADQICQLLLRAQRARAEAELRLLAQALRSVSEAVMVTDLEDRVLQVNEAFCRVYRYEAHELIGKPADIVRSPLNDPALRARLGVGSWQGEMWGRRKDGADFPVAVSTGAVRDEKGVVVAMISVARDITARREADRALIQAKEQAEAASRSKSEFLATMSHEIRTPMNGVIGMLDIALRTATLAEQKELLSTARGSASSLLRILNDILDFSKAEAGRLALNPQPFRIRECVEDVISALGTAACDQSLALLYDIDEAVPDTVIGDPGRLRQILMNLVGNSLKFTEQGMVWLEVGVSSLKDGQALLEMAVSDTGMGIPESLQARVFDSFCQADQSTTRQHGGTGLGLTIARKLVELMQGRIWLRSPWEREAEAAGGPGTQIRFTCQFRVADHLAPGRTQRLPAGARVHVCTNYPPKGRNLARILKAAGAETTVTGNWNQFRLLASRHGGGPDVVALLDAQAIDGPLPVRLAELQTMPVVVLAPAGLPAAPALPVSAGLAYLQKPVRHSELIRLIAEILDTGHRRTAPGAVLPVEHPDEAALRILVAEDNLVNQKVASRLLQMRGHSVLVADNGRQALQAWENQAVDLILMDVHMPVMDGLEATRMIRTMEKDRGRSTPIIALTAAAMQEDRQRCLDAGMDGYLAKPLVAEDLYHLIRAFTSGVDSETAAAR